MYDITIVGAGPAGSTLARLLAKHYKILLLDRRRLDIHSELGAHDKLEKCCGGLIAPDAQHTLARMGLGVPRDVLVGPQLFTVRAIDIINKRERYYQRDYLNIDREKFDSWLVSLIPSEAHVLFGASLKQFETGAGGVVVRYLQDGKEYTAESKLLVGADGAASTVRRFLKPDYRTKKYFSLQEWYEVHKRTSYYTALFDSEITDFYSWTIPKEGYLIIGSALLPDKDPNRCFERLKQRLQAHGYELGHKIKRNGAYILRPQSQGDIYLGQDPVCLIGEAAGWISPTSAEGLSYAFKSALALAGSIKNSPGSVLASYAGNSRKLKLNIMMKNLKGPFMYNRALRGIILRSGLLSMDIIN